MAKQTRGVKKIASTKKAGSTQRAEISNGKIHVEVDKNSQIGVRKIENGYLISESGTTGKGRNQQYYQKEYYSPTDPVSISLPKRSSIKFSKGK